MIAFSSVTLSMNVPLKVYSLLDQWAALQARRVFRKAFQCATAVSSLAVWQNATFVSCLQGHFLHGN